jgi:predicted DsbA family dithiol-disulfide isomerase
MAKISISEFTDPVCPWAWSAEPHRLKLEWTYGDSLSWETRMVGLSQDPAESAKRFTPEEMGKIFAMMSAKFGMPIYEGGPERMYASFPACCAVVATRLNDPLRAKPLLRELRRRCFYGQLIDEAEVIESAAETVGIEPADLKIWLSDDATESAFREDMEAARDPSPAALAMKRKLAESDGGWRYTCPSYVFTLGDYSLTAPGFQPYETYETALANLDPSLEQSAPASSVATALEWAEAQGEGALATVEVAALRGIEPEQARDELIEAGAEETLIGTGSFWSLLNR